MAKKVSQARYYPGNPELSNMNVKELILGTGVLRYPITQLGIEANEGTLFYLNNSLTTISIGASETFQLDNTRIISLRFVKASIDALTNRTDGGGHIIIDFIYEE